GIRAFHVTGVQTCALPISRRERVDQPRQDGGRRGAERDPDRPVYGDHVDTQVPHRGAGDLRVRREDGDEEAALEARPVEADLVQIGRASCRERAMIWVEAE